MIISIDERHGVHNNEFSIHTEKFEDVLDLIRKLDGGVHTLVSIEREDGCQMLVGGGSCGYILTMTTNSMESFHIERSTDEVGDVEMCVGGQFGGYPKKMIVDIDCASRVAVDFFLGKSVEDFNWISD